MLARLLVLLALFAAPAFAQTPDWRETYKVLRFGISSSENSGDAMKRMEPFREYLAKKLGVPVQVYRSSDYAGLVEGMRARQVEFAKMGPATYALAFRTLGGGVEPIARDVDIDGAEGYYSVLAVRADSPYQTLEDLKGKAIGWADPNSTSGYQFPVYFLKKQGIDFRTYFGKSAFAGSHETGVIALLQGTFEVAATFWTSEQIGNIQRMERKGMIPKGSTRIVWRSPIIPNSPYVALSSVPAALKNAFYEAIIDMQNDAPDAWRALTDGNVRRVIPAKHEDYIDVIAVAEDNDRNRKNAPN